MICTFAHLTYYALCMVCFGFLLFSFNLLSHFPPISFLQLTQAVVSFYLYKLFGHLLYYASSFRLYFAYRFLARSLIQYSMAQRIAPQYTWNCVCLTCALLDYVCFEPAHTYNTLMNVLCICFFLSFASYSYAHSYVWMRMSPKSVRVCVAQTVYIF